MLRINLYMLFFLFMVLSVSAQVFKMDSSRYEKKKLSFEEANLVSSYYTQDGNHSSVTGGIGSEKLTDVSNLFDVRLSSYNGNGYKKTYGVELGIDYYTSASSDKIDTRVSSASSSDVRVYPSLSYSSEKLSTGRTIGGRVAFSSEWDYKSYGGGLNYSTLSKNKNTEFGVRINGFFDSYTIVLPTEFRQNTGGGRRDKGVAGTSPRTSLDVSFTLAQILSRRFQMAFILDLAYQQGLLGTPFNRVYLEDGSLKRELLPDKRSKLPLGLRANYTLTDKVVIRSFFRYYRDSWGINSITAQAEVPVKVSDNFVIGPFYRYYQQNGANYFGPYKSLAANSIYYTSDYDLSTCSSNFGGLSGRYNIMKSYGKVALNSIDFRAGYYQRSDGLKSYVLTIGLQIKGF